METQTQKGASQQKLYSTSSLALHKDNKNTLMIIGWITLGLLVIYAIIVFITWWMGIFLFEPYVPNPSNTKNLVMYNSASNQPLSEADEQKRKDMIIASQNRLANPNVVNPYYVES